MEIQTIDFNVWPKGEFNADYAQFFTGNSYLATLEGGLLNVTFEPGCRNNWHIHHKAVQVLICVSGRGWYQEWGKEAVELKPGVVIAIPAEVKHWHGAAQDSWMQHLTYHKAAIEREKSELASTSEREQARLEVKDVQDGASNEWLETVTDEQYDLLK